MSCKLIPLGFHCNITFLQQDLQIKHETGLFEWLECHKLQYMTDIINIVKTKIDTRIIYGVNKNLRVLHPHVFTYHYDLEEYKAIFTRRAVRFLDTIKSSRSLIFARINPLNHSTSAEEIQKFCTIIHTINPDLEIKFLIIHTVHAPEDHKEFDSALVPNATVMQKYFLQSDCPDVYLRNNAVIQSQFLTYLTALGFNAHDVSSNTYTDKD